MTRRVGFGSIRNVFVEELPPGADTGPTHQVVVATRKRLLPLSVGFANFGDHEAFAETIRAWLRAAGVQLPDDPAPGT